MVDSSTQNDRPAKPTVKRINEMSIAFQQAGNLGTAVIEFVDGRFLRVYGSLSHPNILGGWLVLGLVAVIFLYTTSKTPLAKIFLISIHLH